MHRTLHLSSVIYVICPNSYRPISNLPYLSKLIECVVADQFREHLATFNLLPAQQSTYRSFHSTETALLSVHNDLVRSVDSGKVSLLVLLDLSAAFDTVDHHILLTIISKLFSMESTTLSWFESFLADRTQSFTDAGRDAQFSSRLQCTSRLGPGSTLFCVVH